jgi:hypothetical protein
MFFKKEKIEGASVKVEQQEQEANALSECGHGLLNLLSSSSCASLRSGIPRIVKINLNYPVGKND